MPAWLLPASRPEGFRGLHNSHEQWWAACSHSPASEVDTKKLQVNGSRPIRKTWRLVFERWEENRKSIWVLSRGAQLTGVFQPYKRYKLPSHHWRHYDSYFFTLQKPRHVIALQECRWWNRFPEVLYQVYSQTQVTSRLSLYTCNKNTTPKPMQPTMLSKVSFRTCIPGRPIYQFNWSMGIIISGLLASTAKAFKFRCRDSRMYFLCS